MKKIVPPKDIPMQVTFRDGISFDEALAKKYGISDPSTAKWLVDWYRKMYDFQEAHRDTDNSISIEEAIKNGDYTSVTDEDGHEMYRIYTTGFRPDGTEDICFLYPDNKASIYRNCRLVNPSEEEAVTLSEHDLSIKFEYDSLDNAEVEITTT